MQTISKKEAIKITHEEILKIAPKLKVISIVGGLGTGKTCLSFSILEEILKTKPVFVYRHPNPELIEARGYRALYEFGELEHISNCALGFDEPQIFLKHYEKRANDSLERLMTLCRQRNITLVLSTADTRFITRGIEFYIDAWFILDINSDLVKQGSCISKIIQKNALITTQQWRLPQGKYLFDSREYFKLNGLKEFSKPAWFTDEFSKSFGINFVQCPSETATNSATISATNKTATETAPTAQQTKGDDV